MTDNLAKIEPTAEHTAMPDKRTSGVRITGIDQCRAALTNLSRINALRSYVDEALSHPIIAEHRDTVVVPSDDYARVKSLVKSVYFVGHTLLNAINQSMPKQSPLSVTIEIPQQEELSDLKEFVDDIHWMISTLTGNRFASPKVQNFDNGSLCIELIFDGAKAIALLYAVARAALWINRELQRHDAEHERNRALGLAVDDLEQSVRLKQKVTDLMIEKLATDIAGKHYKDATREDISVLMRIIEKNQRLSERGMKLIQAHNAPTNLKDEFPEFAGAALSDLGINLLQEKHGSTPKLLGSGTDGDKSE
ncbi:hypothetical protein WME89_29440 [Sorangium sp. So ce321]|uniref:hypothetical protein n=1 Tax=Sorangium sp. So ce321 TaxID=3133300 RepID=UPI003F5DC51C